METKNSKSAQTDTKPSSQADAQESRAELSGKFGRYQIVKRLGQGGMGAVYLANDTQLSRQVALKVPLFGKGDGPKILERFAREARAAATLNHPNLCPIYDVGEVNGTPYLTMAFVEGRPLSHFIRAGKPLPPRQAAAIVRKLAIAMQEAHANGVVHRDLKPSNIIFNQRKEPIVMDFGLAHITRTEEARLTGAGAVLGTPAYMAPEQVGGTTEAVGPSCDIYSLGVILYELLTSRLPFEGPTLAVLGQVLVANPEPPSMHRPGLDPRLEAICLRAMAKQPGDRFRSMAEMAQELTKFIQISTTEATDSGTSTEASASKASDPFAALTQSQPTSTARLPNRQHPRAALFAAIGAGGMILLALGYFAIRDNLGTPPNKSQRQATDSVRSEKKLNQPANPTTASKNDAGPIELRYDFTDQSQLKDFEIQVGKWEIREGALFGVAAKNQNATLLLKRQFDGFPRVSWEQTLVPEPAIEDVNERKGGISLADKESNGLHYDSSYHADGGFGPEGTGFHNELHLFAGFEFEPGRGAYGPIGRVLNRGQPMVFGKKYDLHMSITVKDGKSVVRLGGADWEIANARIDNIQPKWLRLWARNCGVKFENLRVETPPARTP